MSGPDAWFIYLRSKDDGPWEQIEPMAGSVVKWMLAELEPGQIYDDGYGNRYRWEHKED